jgi:4-hydroxybenzoate polyprenyltransferase
MRPNSQIRTLIFLIVGIGVVIVGMVSEFLLGAYLPSEIMQILYMNGGFLIIICLCFGGGFIFIRRVLLGEWCYRYDSIIYLIAATICLTSAGQTLLGLQIGHPWLYLQTINPVLMNLLWMFVLPPLTPWIILVMGVVFILLAVLNYKILAPKRRDVKDMEKHGQHPETPDWWEILGTLTRISVWLGSLFLFILSFVLLGSPPLVTHPWISLYDPRIWLILFFGIIAICFFNSAIFIINQLGDIDTDRLHIEKAKLPVSSGRVSKKRAIIIALGFFLLGLVFSLLVSQIFLLFILITYLFALLYSFRPIRLKGRPFLDLMIIGIGFGSWAVVTAWAIYAGASIFFFPLPFLPSSLLLGAGFFYAGTHGIHTASDWSADAQAGVNTTAVFLGPKKATKIGISLIGIGLLLLYASVGYYTHLFWYGLLKYKSIFLLIFLGLPFFALFQQFRSWQQHRNPNETQIHQLQKRGRLVTYLLFLILLIYLLLYVFFFYPMYYPNYYFPWL